MNLKTSRPRSRHPCLTPFGRLSVWGAILCGAWVLPLGQSAQADPQPVTIQGVPQQVIPQAAEIGLGDFTLSTGTISILGGGGSTSGGGSGGGSSTSSDALDTMMAASWGSAAAQNAQALGVNSTALAATCVIESGCQNLNTATATSSVTGAFQMTNATYNAMLSSALSQNPNLASNIVQGTAGQNDPATQAIAAAEYLHQGAQALQNAGVANPTVLDVRGYYNFGPSGAALATADPNATMASVLSNTSATVLKNNGITAGETVAQWQASVSAKIGNAATAPVLT